MPRNSAISLSSSTAASQSQLSLELVQGSVLNSSNLNLLANTNATDKLDLHVLNEFRVMPLESLLNITRTQTNYSIEELGLKKLNSILSSMFSSWNNKTEGQLTASDLHPRLDRLLPLNTVLPIGLLSSSIRTKTIATVGTLVDNSTTQQQPIYGSDFLSPALNNSAANSTIQSQNSTLNSQSNSSTAKRQQAHFEEQDFEEVFEDAHEGSDTTKKSTFAKIIKSGIKVLQKIVESLE